MGFIKFAILATMGELLALRLANKAWIKPAGLIFKIVVWGLIGVLITFMFSFYSAEVSAMVVKLGIPPGNQLLSNLLTAFMTSAIMNLTFGVVFMAMHRMSDTYIEMRFKQTKPTLKELIKAINWDVFISYADPSLSSALSSAFFRILLTSSDEAALLAFWDWGGGRCELLSLAISSSMVRGWRHP